MDETLDCLSKNEKNSWLKNAGITLDISPEQGLAIKADLTLKEGGDKSGNSFKMNFQIVNTPTPNSVQNTCVFSIFEADDSTTNLHVALD